MPMFVLLIVMLLVPGSQVSDREAVRMAVLDYVEGIYQMQPERVERSVHPNLAKIGFYRPSASSEFNAPSPMTYDALIRIAKNFNKDGKLPANAPKEIVIYDVLERTATVKLTADWGVDYMHLGKFDGQWKIINVIWQSPPQQKASR